MLARIATQAEADSPLDRSMWDRLRENLADAYANSGAGQFERGSDPDLDGFQLADLLQVNILADGRTDRALDALFGDDRSYWRTSDPAAAPAARRERARAEAYDARGMLDPIENAGDAAAFFAGQAAGSAVSAENWIAPGRTVVGRAVAGGLVAAGADAIIQADRVTDDVQDEYRPEQTALAGVLGSGFSLAGDAGSAIARRAQSGPNAAVRALAGEIDASSRAYIGQEPPAPAARAAQARVEIDALDRQAIGPTNGRTYESDLDALLDFEPAPQPTVERELDALFEWRGQSDQSSVASPDGSAAAQPPGSADGSAIDLGGTGDAGRVFDNAESPPPRDPADFDHLDQNHANLWRLGESGDAAAANDLSRRMSRFMDWSDVALSRADRAAVDAGEPVSSRAMIVAARDYRETGGGGSFYDPEAYPDAMVAGRSAERDAAPPAPSEPRRSTDYQGRQIIADTFDPKQVDADPATFQYKASGDEGLTDRLAGVTQWDRTAAGRSILFEDAAGRVVVADGHQRRGLARRLIESGQDTTASLDGFLFRAADGWTPSDVRVVAALKNIREGSGSILDAAKVFREAPDRINDRSLPVTGDFIASARGLARLSDDAFGAVAAGVIPERYAAVIGELAPDRPDLHASIVDVIRQGDPRSLDEARAFVQEAKLADFVERQGDTLDMFGGLPKESTIIARGRLRAAVMKQLRGDARLFSALVRNADVIEAGGNALARDTNASRVAADLAASSAIDKLALRAGTIGDTFGEAAGAIARGDLTVAQGVRNIVADLREATRRGADVDADRAVILTPSAPSEPARAALKPFDEPGGRGQVAQAQPKPEDAGRESATLWDDLPAIGDEDRALDVLSICAPGGR
ncbi:hypothetical protein [Brevundimonas sp. TWP2-3-4b1]|uniref:hypothetical protein n=1 Tax=Brevundimonas sp. TWP2-3-4b1 TaxID=2804580 RepID=UPI003CEEFDE9